MWENRFGLRQTGIGQDSKLSCNVSANQSTTPSMKILKRKGMLVYTSHVLFHLNPPKTLRITSFSTGRYIQSITLIILSAKNTKQVKTSLSSTIILIQRSAK